MKAPKLTGAILLALFDHINALVANLPEPTASVELALDGWTPKPTAAPELLRSLKKRQITLGDDSNDDNGEDDTTVYFAPDQTCGFIDGRPGAQFSCSIDFQCVLFTASSSLTGNVACCNTETCGVRLACVDYQSYYSSDGCDDACNLDAFTLKCTDTAMPYCNTVSLESDIYDYWCNNVAVTTVLTGMTTYSGQTGRSFSPFLLTENASTTQDLELKPDSTGVGPDVTDSIGDEADDDNNSNNSDRNGDKNGDDDSTPIGAIVGGVVGGVAAIGLGALGLWLFFRNKKKKQAAAAQASPASAPAYQQSPPPQGMAQQSYNPHHSYFDPKFAAAAGVQPYQQYPPQQQQHQPGGFYPMGNAPPGTTAASSPTMAYGDPNVSNTNSVIYPSGISQSPPPPASSTSPNPYGAPAYQQQQQQQPNGGFIHEAPSRPDETHRGGVHEIG